MRKLTTEARAAIRQAELEARREGSRSVEAEHLLLALSDAEGTDAGAALHSAGLGRNAINAALERDVRKTLIAVGVSIDRPEGSPRMGRPAQRLRMGRSAKLVFQRAIKTSAKRADKELGTAHLLLGLLQARVGTVPRALEEAGVDRSALAASIEGALPASGR